MSELELDDTNALLSILDVMHGLRERQHEPTAIAEARLLSLQMLCFAVLC
jgi:hypothetical protein